jgi:protein TonB
MSRSVQLKTKARNRILAGALSLGAHALVLGAIFSMQPTGPMRVEPEPIEVAMITLPPPPPPPPDPPQPPAPKKGEPKPAKIKAKPVRTMRKTPRPPPTVEPIFAKTSDKP